MMNASQNPMGSATDRVGAYTDSFQFMDKSCRYTLL
jgi:hypothetical protein